MKKWLVAVLAVFVLAACGNEQEASPENLQKTIDEGTVGFEMMGDSVQEEADVPEEEKIILYLLSMNILQPLMKKI